MMRDVVLTPGTPIREERKVVTALFADVVGSTALGELLDPEELKLVVGEAIARIVHAVEAFGGTIKDLAGDGLLALFGAPAVHEDDPERAIRAGLQIVEVIGEYAQEVAQSWGVRGFGVRVGVNTGPVALGAVGAGERIEYAAVGDAVNTAARLQAAAEPGSVLVGSETKRLTEPMFEWSGERELELKGKEGVVTGGHRREPNHDVHLCPRRSGLGDRPLGRTTKRFVDAAGRVLSTTDPLGYRTRYTYDAMGNLTSVTDARSKTTSFLYDEDSNLVRITDALNHQTN
ncbi:MAG: adenylate/guanylate cyclase domain-containing protein, partial [Candidatus Velamenicoccus archaeovorus]